jgi:hypothetical protein
LGFAAYGGFTKWHRSHDPIPHTGSREGHGTNLLGRAIVFNTAVDYTIKGRIWPMLEQNSVFWSGGTLDGKKQIFLTPGLVLGSFPVAESLRFAIGTGVQITTAGFSRCAFRSETERTRVKQNP